MRDLSKKEWIAAAAAMIVVGYSLFSGDILSLFQKNISENSLSAASPVSGTVGGVIINNVLIGEGEEVRPGQLVSTHYVLSLSDGTVVQNSKDFGAPFQFIFGAGEVIPGWEMGFEGVRVGGVRTIIIPPELGYGSNQTGPIPPNSTLIFTVEVVDAVNVTPELVQ